MLTAITRTYRRPTFLARNRASLVAQTSADWHQELVVDESGTGIPATYLRLRSQDADGDLVWVFDDDNVLTDDTFVRRMHEEAAAGAEVIICPIKHPNLGGLPSAWPPACGQIDMMNIVVTRDVWYKHRHAFAPLYEGDWHFIDDVLKGGHRVTLTAETIGGPQAVMYGRSEDNYERTVNVKVGDKFTAKLDINGMDPDMTCFNYQAGQTVEVTAGNWTRVRSLAMGGLLVESVPFR